MKSLLNTALIGLLFFIIYFIGQDLKQCKTQLSETQNIISSTLDLLNDEKELNKKIIANQEMIVDIIESYHPK